MNRMNRTDRTCVAVIAASMLLTAAALYASIQLRTKIIELRAEVTTIRETIQEHTEHRVEPIQPEPVPAESEQVAEPEPESLGLFKLTAYCPCAKCCGAWADGITFTGAVATPGRTIAVDPSVIPLGSTVIINGKEYVAEDIGGAIKGDRIDIFFATHDDALQFGVQYADVKIKP